MNFKKFTLALCVIAWSLTGYSQQNPDNEILVFFSDGVSQKIETVNGTPIKTVNVTKKGLRQSLNVVGIPDSLMEFALPDFKKEDTLKILSDGREIKRPDMSKLIRIKVPKGKERKELVEYLNNLPEVLYAEPNGRAVPHVIPTDTRFNDQWGLRNTVNPGADIHVEAAWDIYTGNSSNIIAIIDGGTDINHEDLNGKISGGDTSYGWDGHGIHVSGIAAAESNNSQGISGVDWNARIHPQRIDNVDDAGTYQAIVDAVNYSPNVFVLNNSWGLVDENQNPGRYSTTVRQAFAYAYKANRTCVASMGNHQQTNPDVINYPAGFGNIIAVGATNNADVIGGFSVHGSHIDVCAPGVGILSTVNGGYEQFGWDGTSMAAPHVSGIASLLKGYSPNLANDDIENIIRLSADEVVGMNGQNFTNTYGFGRVNAERALNLLRTPNTFNQWTASGGTVFSSTGTYTAQFIGAPGLSTANYLVKRHEVRKTITFPANFLCVEGVWGRGVFTTGWNLASPNFGEGFCEVVAGTQTNTSVTLRTHVYEIWSIGGSYLGYYPKSPSNVSFAYSVLGILSPIISGPSLVCTSGATYTIILPAGLTATWTCTSTNNNLAINPTTGYAYATNTVAGTGTVSAIVHTGCGDITLPAKNIYVGSLPAPVLSGNTTVKCGYQLTYRVDNVNQINGTSFYWESDVLSISNASSPTCTVWGTFDGTGYISCTVTACGISKTTTRAVEVILCDFLLLSPNPATNETTVSIESSSDKGFDTSALWDLEVYEQGQILKIKKSDVKGRQYSISTSGWKDGVYIVRAKIGDQIITNKLVVKH